MPDSGNPSAAKAAADLAAKVAAAKVAAMPLALSDRVKLAGLTARVVAPLIDIPVDGNLASEFYKRLAEWIRRFDATLDDAHEVGVRLVSFGRALTFHLEGMGYWNPSLISFQGFTEQGEPVELIQHVSQISILLQKVERADPSKPKQPIGFSMPTEEPTGQT